jgi:hypothetical protein
MFEYVAKVVEIIAEHVEGIFIDVEYYAVEVDI